MRWVIPFLLLAGCASVENTHEWMADWIGKPEARLVEVWGAPDRAYPLTDGSRVVTYSEEWGTGDSMKCDASFVIGNDGTVQSYSLDGNACASR